MCVVCSPRVIGNAKDLHFAYPHKKKVNHLVVVDALPSRRILTLVVILTLSVGAFVLSTGEAQAEQKITAIPQPTVTTSSVSPLVPPPLVPKAEQLPPVQTSAFDIALPKAPPAVSVSDDAISPVDRLDRSPVSDKPSTSPTAKGTTAGEDDSYAPITPDKKKVAAEEPLLAKPLDRQQAAASAPPASLTAEPKKNQASRASSSEPLAGGLLSKLSPLSKEEEAAAEKNKDPLSPPLKQEKKPSVLLWATSDGSGAQAQRLPKAQEEAALEAPTRAILLPLGVSPAANDTITAAAAAVPIDHPGASTATSASILWKAAPGGVGSARDLPTPHPKPSGSIVAAIDNTVHQQLVSDLASSHESPLSGRQIPSEGTPPASQPSSPPPVPFEPWHQDSFGLSGGGSMSSSTGGISPLLLLGILALGGYFLLRPYSRTYLLASCELPKLSSALPTPLERPG
jgi:hypothetical protein